MYNRYETKVDRGKTAEEEKLKENRSHKIERKTEKENDGFQHLDQLLASQSGASGSIPGEFM
jgi:hypothetical protein